MNLLYPEYTDLNDIRLYKCPSTSTHWINSSNKKKQPFDHTVSETWYFIVMILCINIVQIISGWMGWDDWIFFKILYILHLRSHRCKSPHFHHTELMTKWFKRLQGFRHNMKMTAELHRNVSVGNWLAAGVFKVLATSFICINSFKPLGFCWHGQHRREQKQRCFLT